MYTSELSTDFLQMLKLASRLKWDISQVTDLRPSECELLTLLYSNFIDGKTNLQASEISRQLKITPAGVTHLLNPLSESGYIKRAKNPSDKRFVLISLTSKGKRLADTLRKDSRKKISDIAKHLGDEDAKTFIRIMTSIASYLEDHQT
jgi:DNA-binding MarR family transcriptional regulator